MRIVGFTWGGDRANLQGFILLHYEILRVGYQKT